MNSSLLGVVAATAVFILFPGCAGQGAPPGGPVDLSGPAIVRTYPDSNAVRVMPDRIEIEFDEYVDRRAVEEALFISPYLGTLSLGWSGTELTIEFSEALRPNVTYVVSLGTDVIDVRGNRMPSGFSLAFATGDSIDRGQITGRVIAPRPEGVAVFAYALADRRPDTLNPAAVRPDYVTQSGAGGRYSLNNLAFGTYRLYAVRDEYKNLVYDLGVDDIGVYTGDVTLSEVQPSVSGVFFILAREDTVRPYLSTAEAIDRHTVRLGFSERIDSASFARGQMTVTDTLSGATLAEGARILQTRTVSEGVLVLIDSLRSGRGYRVRCDGIRDSSGNEGLLPALQAVFEGSSIPDTSRPSPSVSGIADSSRGIALASVLTLQFSEPVVRPPVERDVRLLDSLSTPVAVTTRWSDARTLLLAPKEVLRPRSWYRLQLTMGSVADLHGNTYRDSVWALRFESVDTRTTGSISGTVVDARPGFRAGPVTLLLEPIGGAAGAPRRYPLQNNRIALDQVTEGRYLVTGFMDADSSGTYGVGRPFPFIPAERYAVYPDTVRVRARWSVENLFLEFR